MDGWMGWWTDDFCFIVWLKGRPENKRTTTSESESERAVKTVLGSSFSFCTAAITHLPFPSRRHTNGSACFRSPPTTRINRHPRGADPFPFYPFPCLREGMARQTDASIISPRFPRKRRARDIIVSVLRRTPGRRRRARCGPPAAARWGPGPSGAPAPTGR
jgi:hypothetical protein